MNRRGFLQSLLAAATMNPLRELESAVADPARAKQPAVQPSEAMAGTDFLRAMSAVREAIPLAEADPERPVYHFRPPANWTNDPNAPFYYRGWHHLFYQLNPFETRIGNQHWGHARSRDLVNWDHLPIAICPSPDRGETAIFSGGSAFASDGRPRLIYTSIGQREPEQWMALPQDEELFTWNKYAHNPVVSQAVHKSGPIAQWRDPFLFKKEGSTYMVCGGGTSTGRAQVQLYRAANGDFTEWVHLGPIFQTLDRDVRNFECPNLFPLDGKWVLVVSPNRVCEYWVGDLDIEKMKFEPSAHGILDPGDSYASNISVDPEGRTILWLWGRTNTPEGKGWNGVMTLPRVLSLDAEGYLRQNPIRETETLREPIRTFPERNPGSSAAIEGVATDCAEIEAVFAGDGTFGLELRRSAEGKAGIVVSVQTGSRGAYLNVGDKRAFLGYSDRYKLRVFLDKRCMEVFANDGAAAIYMWLDAPVTAKGIGAFGQVANKPVFPGGKTPAPPRLESLKVWPMKSATFSLEHFHA
jgi:sucrose-6-phosphate hydrolase SacC (GH32 family)